MAMANGLEWAGQSAFFAAPLQPLKLGGVEAGQVKKSGKLTFVQIEAAGHMVPMDQVGRSLLTHCTLTHCTLEHCRLEHCTLTTTRCHSLLTATRMVVLSAAHTVHSPPPRRRRARG
jgi:hypothetical protein